MKKYLLIAALLSAICCFSQQPQKKAAFGIKFGLGISKLSPDYFDTAGYRFDYQSKVIIHFGIRTEIPVSKKVLLMPELCLLDKGSKSNITYVNNYTYSGKNVMWFLEFTPNLLFRLPSKTGSFDLGGGPSAAIAVTQLTGQLGNSDLGVNILARYTTPVGLSIELNYNKGLKDQPADQLTGPYTYKDHHKMKTSQIGLSVGYLF